MQYALKSDSLPRRANEFFDVDYNTSSVANAYLIDPGLAHYRGHHYTLDVALRNASATVYSSVNVLCHASFPVQTGFIPCFRASIYQYTAQTVEEVNQVCEAHAQVIFEDLSMALNSRIRKNDAILIPSCNITLLIGLRRWLESLPVYCRPMKLQLHFHALATHEIYSVPAQARLNLLFEAEAMRINQCFDVRWSTDSRRLADAYTILCRFQFLALKSPHAVPSEKTRVHRQDGRIRLLVIGELRPEKGIELILKALPGVLSNTKYCDFRFVVPSLQKNVHSYLLNQPVGRVSLRIEDELSYTEYCDEITYADYVLCVYDPEQYHFRSSGVVVEAVLLNVPVVISRGMAVEDDILDRENIFILPDQQPPSLERLCITFDKKFDLQVRNTMQTVQSVLPLSAVNLSPGWHIYGSDINLQTPFDVAVVMPTIGRESVLAAVSSVYAQENVGRIQLLIGVDAPLDEFTRLQELLAAAPAHVTPCLFYPGYSTSVRHGGLHPARDGGALRTTLSYLANARYIAYLDDDNWWAPLHLRSMLDAIDGHEWVFALRWFVHPDSRQPVCIDDWESVGPGRGNFVASFGGWVDPNCLMIDKLACEPVLRWWSIPLPGDPVGMSADRHIYDWLQKKNVPGESNLASVYYTMQPTDAIHASRLIRMGTRYIEAGELAKQSPPRLTAITTCKGRLQHIKQTLPLLVNQPGIAVVVVDYGCTQGTAAWVRENHPEVSVIEVTDDPEFNLARARNLGANAASTPWLLFIDADVKVADLKGWEQHGLRADGFYITRAYGTDLTGSFFCTRQMYEKAGGYDEAIRGWGGEDDDMYYRLAKAGYQQRIYPDDLFASIAHSEGERFAFYPDSSKQKQWMINQWYRCMKYDLITTWGRELSLEERLSIRALAKEAALNAIGEGGINQTELFIDLGERVDLVKFTDWSLGRRIVYKVCRRPQ